MVVWNQVGLPCGEEFVLQVVHHVALHGGISSHTILCFAQGLCSLDGELGCAFGFVLFLFSFRQLVVLLMLVEHTTSEVVTPGL